MAVYRLSAARDDAQSLAGKPSHTGKTSLPSSLFIRLARFCFDSRNHCLDFSVHNYSLIFASSRTIRLQTKSATGTSAARIASRLSLSLCSWAMPTALSRRVTVFESGVLITVALLFFIVTLSSTAAPRVTAVTSVLMALRRRWLPFLRRGIHFNESRSIIHNGKIHATLIFIYLSE
jgi:hypothetical protein